jgi:inner membrane transporter RhtA
MASVDATTAPRLGAGLSRIPSPALVLGAIGSIQFGAALAATLFDELGPAGAVTLRLVTATILLMAVWRPRLRGLGRSELLLAALFGLILGGMNLCFY